MADSGQLFGVRALVCGGANGIGEAIARTLVRHDAKVLAADHPDTDISTRYRDVPGVSGLAMSLTGEDSPVAAVHAAREGLDGLDAVVICLHSQPQRPLDSAAAYADYNNRRLALTRAYFDAALSPLQKSPGGRFIVIGLLRSAFSRDSQTLFDQSEQDLAALVRELANRAGEFGIAVNYIQPGALMTPESRRIFSDDKSLRDFCIAKSAARRLGEPLDVAKAALFLASDDATFVSGTGIAVDGGRSK